MTQKELLFLELNSAIIELNKAKDNNDNITIAFYKGLASGILSLADTTGIISYREYTELTNRIN